MHFAQNKQHRKTKQRATIGIQNGFVIPAPTVPEMLKYYNYLETAFMIPVEDLSMSNLTEKAVE